MKPLTILIAVLFSCTMYAQLPQAIKYQAVARDEGGHILDNKQISVKVSIIDSSLSQVVYTEIHKEGTNQFGLFTIEIGRGLVPTGNFQNIDWPSGNKWLMMELDPEGGSDYTVMGISEMVSVPYAFYAGSAVNMVEDSTDELQTLSLSGNMLTISAGNTVTLPQTIDTDDQNLSLTGTTLAIEDGNSVDLSVLQDGVNDADSDPTNELQNLDISGDSLFISGGNSVVLQGQGDNDWVVNGNDMYNGNSGSTGVGTSVPDQSAVLDVSSIDKGLLTPRMTSTQRLAITNPATGLEVFDITAGIKMFYNGQRWLEVGADPIGTIQAFHKSLSGTPALPWGWAECNGQTLNDPESPYNGGTLPSLNSPFNSEAGTTSSAGYFLRGGTASGVLSTDQTNTLYQFGHVNAVNCNACTQTVPINGTFSPSHRYDGDPDQSRGMRFRNRGVETYPGNMTVVWVIRVK